MSMHNLWQQETIPIIITTRNIRPGIRKIIDINVLIKRIRKKYFFGFNYHKQGNFYFPYSDIEKTFIDVVYFRIKLNKEEIKDILVKLDIKKLNSYLKIYPKITRKRVLSIIDKANRKS